MFVTKVISLAGLSKPGDIKVPPLFRKLSQMDPSLLAVLNRDGKVIYLSDQSRDIFGDKANLIQGNCVFGQFQDGEYYNVRKIKAIMRFVRRQRKEVRVEFPIEDAQGFVVWIDGKVKPVKESTGFVAISAYNINGWTGPNGEIKFASWPLLGNE